MSETSLCSITIATRTEDLERFNNDEPQGVGIAPITMVCELSAGHSGSHVYGIQSYAHQTEDGEASETYWWAWWGDDEPEPYRLAESDACPGVYSHEGGEDWICCLPLNHAGPHGPGQAPPEDEPPGAYCACSDPNCPTPDGQYTHG